MDLVHMHLLLNHFPVIGMVIGLLIFIFAFFKKSNELKKVSLGIFVFLALVAIPVYFSGEPAEESVENLPGFSDAITEQHEDAAVIALTSVIILGIVSLIALLLFKNPKISLWLTVLCLLMAIVTTGLMAFTANLGGQIRHTEIRSGATAGPNETQARPIEAD